MPKATASLSTTLHLLHRATQLADSAFMRYLPPEANLTPRQLAVLEAVAANNGLSQTDIMAATGIDRSSIAALVKRLIKHGCLQRRSSSDARLYAVKLTPTATSSLQWAHLPHGQSRTNSWRAFREANGKLS